MASNASSASCVIGRPAALERDTKGPAHTFTPVNLWDVRLNHDADLTIDLPEGHNAMVAVLNGHVTVNGEQPAGEAEIVRFERSGSKVRIRADGDSILLMLTGEPICCR